MTVNKNGALTHSRGDPSPPAPTTKHVSLDGAPMRSSVLIRARHGVAWVSTAYRVPHPGHPRPFLEDAGQGGGGGLAPVPIHRTPPFHPRTPKKPCLEHSFLGHTRSQDYTGFQGQSACWCARDFSRSR